MPIGSIIKGTGTGGLRNTRTSGDHPNYNIIEIGQKSPGDLRRLIVSQDFNGKPSAYIGEKNS